MSEINGIQFPNTTFPDEAQRLPNFVDLQESQEGIYIRYLKAILNNNVTEAKSCLADLISSSGEGSPVISANTLNIMSDTINAIQTLYSSTSIFDDVLQSRQDKWLGILNQFGFVGDWIQPQNFNTAIVYSMNSIVKYNNVMWIRAGQTSTQAGLVPQEDSPYWKPYYRKNTMVSFIDEDSNTRFLYLAMRDVSTLNNPSVNSASTGTDKDWFQITIQGLKGDDGEGFSFKNYWSSANTYTIGDLVVYNGNCYSSLKDQNINHNPGVSTTWWKKEFTTEAVKIPIQAQAPTDQKSGDIWFQLIDLV